MSLSIVQSATNSVGGILPGVGRVGEHVGVGLQFEHGLAQYALMVS